MKPLDRVQVPAYSDAWMMGDRYGTVVEPPTRKPRVNWTAVRMDKSGRVFLFVTADLQIV